LQSTVSPSGELFYAGGEIFTATADSSRARPHRFVLATLNSGARTSVHTSHRMLSPSQRYLSRRRAMFTARDAMFTGRNAYGQFIGQRLRRNTNN
jgi:hypothetical protein